MASEAYLALLRDPRWQKKRLAVMKRDRWTCRKCGDKTTTLNVHHLRYEHGKRPWQYSASDLLTLCERCHERISKVSRNLDSVGSWHELTPVQRLCGITIALRISSVNHEDERTVIAHPSVDALVAIGESLDGIAKTKGFRAAVPIMGLLAQGHEPRLRILDMVESIAATIEPEAWQRATAASEATP